MHLEDYPPTKEGGVDFVRDVFCSMGGRVLPDQGQMQNNLGTESKLKKWNVG